MSQKTIDNFLNEYKHLEEILKRYDSSIYDLENSPELNPKEAEQLRLCRMTRNYLQHNVGTFVTPTDSMTDFIKNDCCALVMRKYNIATIKDYMVKLPAIKTSETVLQAENTYIKNRETITGKGFSAIDYKCPVVDDDNVVIGMMSSVALIRILAEHKPGITLQKCLAQEDLEPFQAIAPSTAYLSDNYIPCLVVTLDGTERGKYRGVVPYYRNFDIVTRYI